MILDQGFLEREKKKFAEGEAEGRAKGKAEAVLAVLDARGLRVTAAQGRQVLGCTDDALLDAWVRAAVTAPSVKALLSAGAPRRARDERS